MTLPGLLTRRISPADALGYYALRTRSLEGLAYAIEPQVLDELNAGSGGMADLLLRYHLEGTRVWGVSTSTR